MSPRYLWLARLAIVAALLSAAGSCGSSEPSKSDAATGADGAASGDGATRRDATQPDAAKPPPSIADIRADTNRDGVVSFDDAADDKDEHTWTAAHGAVFLANIDDDTRRCAFNETISDLELPKCHDAADDVVNGKADEEDLALVRVRAWPQAPAGATWKVTPSSKAAAHVRLFVRNDKGALVLYTSDAAGAAAAGGVEALRKGIELRIEAKDIVRDRSVWDGFVDLTLEITADGKSHSDVVRMRVAPLILAHHLQPVRSVYVARLRGDSGSSAFRTDLSAAISATATPPKLVLVDGDDQWTQDHFETATMSMPLPGGKTKVIDVFIRSANVYEPTSRHFPLRPASRVVFSARGVDVAAVQAVDVKHDQDMDTLDACGNLETVPPHTAPDGKAYPFGRIIRGSTPSYHPDETHQKMLDAQGVQPTLKVDTSWLSVAHVDETLSFVRAPASKRGWVVLVADPAAAVAMLRKAKSDGHGAAAMFVNKAWLDVNDRELRAETTVDGVLGDPDVMAASAAAAIEIQKHKDILKREVGLADADFVAAPFTFDSEMGYSIAHLPATVNGLALSDGVFAAPKPHGPLINNVAIFEDRLSTALAAHKVAVHWVEDWDLYHRLGGEVHCGGNTQRAAPADPAWWKVIR